MGMVSAVYAIMNVREKRNYVGFSGEVRKRILDHKNALKKGCCSTRSLQADWDRLGPDEFSFMVLEIDVPKHQSVSREQFWMDALGGQKRGYNIRGALKL